MSDESGLHAFDLTMEVGMLLLILRIVLHHRPTDAAHEVRGGCFLCSSALGDRECPNTAIKWDDERLMTHGPHPTLVVPAGASMVMHWRMITGVP
jgi:hypothetical protein